MEDPLNINSCICCTVEILKIMQIITKSIDQSFYEADNCSASYEILSLLPNTNAFTFFPGTCRCPHEEPAKWS
jgi:hypothetical protein